MQKIGFLIALNEGGPFVGVCCVECHAGATIHPLNRPIPLYRANVLPYRQTCHGCGKTLVVGLTPKWPELFPKADAS